MARSARCPLPGGSWPLLLLIWAAGTADHAPAAGAAAHLSRKCSPSERALILHPPSVGRAQRAVDRCSAGVSPAKDPRHLPVRLRGGGQENNAGGWVLRGGGGPLDGATEPQVDFANEYAKMFGDFPVAPANPGGEQKEYDPHYVWSKVPELARKHGLPFAPDNPNLMDKVSDRDATNAFPGGGREGLDLPEIKWLYQSCPGFGRPKGADVLHPGDEVLVTPQNSCEESYIGTVADIDVILAQETPTDPLALTYRYVVSMDMFVGPPQVPSLDMEPAAYLRKFYPSMPVDVIGWLHNITRDDGLVAVIVKDPEDNATLLKEVDRDWVSPTGGGSPKLGKGQTRENTIDMFYACVAGDVGRVEYCLSQKGVNIHARDPDRASMTGLHLAASQGNADVCQLLLERGADPLFTDRNGRLPLHHAAICSSLPCIRMLLEAGSPVDAVDEEWKTSLHHAAVNNFAQPEEGVPYIESWPDSPGVVDLLIQGGADVMLLDSRKRTALHQAAFIGNKLSIQLLIAAGPQAQNIKNDEGHTPSQATFTGEARSLGLPDHPYEGGDLGELQRLVDICRNAMPEDDADKDPSEARREARAKEEEDAIVWDEPADEPAAV